MPIPALRGWNRSRCRFAKGITYSGPCFKEEPEPGDLPMIMGTLTQTIRKIGDNLLKWKEFP
jgi:hypothetical protein